MSASPGIRNFPVASRLPAPRGIAVEPAGPSVAIRSPAISNVIYGFGGETVASITVTWVIARAGMVGLEQEESSVMTVSAKSAGVRLRPTRILGKGIRS